MNFKFNWFYLMTFSSLSAGFLSAMFIFMSEDYMFSGDTTSNMTTLNLALSAFIPIGLALALFPVIRRVPRWIPILISLILVLISTNLSLFWFYNSEWWLYPSDLAWGLFWIYGGPVACFQVASLSFGTTVCFGTLHAFPSRGSMQSNAKSNGDKILFCVIILTGLVTSYLWLFSFKTHVDLLKWQSIITSVLPVFGFVLDLPVLKKSNNEDFEEQELSKEEFTRYRRKRTGRIQDWFVLLALLLSGYVSSSIMGSLCPQMVPIPYILNWWIIVMVSAIFWALISRINRRINIPAIGGVFCLLFAFLIIISDIYSPLVDWTALNYITAINIGAVWTGVINFSDMGLGIRLGFRRRIKFCTWFISIASILLALISSSLGFLMRYDLFQEERNTIALIGVVMTITLVAFFTTTKLILPRLGIKYKMKKFKMRKKMGGKNRANKRSIIPEKHQRLASILLVSGLIVSIAPVFITLPLQMVPPRVHSLGSFGLPEGKPGRYADYFLWMVDSNTKVNPYSEVEYNPQYDDPVVTLAGAAGETESFQVVCTPLAEPTLNVMDFRAQGDLVSGNNTISRDNIEIFSEKLVEQYSRTVYDEMVEFGKEDIVAGLNGIKNHVFWIDVYIPRGTPEGVYTCEFYFACRDYVFQSPEGETGYITRPVMFSLALEVFGFELPLQHSQPGYLMDVYDQETTEKVLKHRFDPIYPYPSPVVLYNATPGNLSITFDFPSYFIDLYWALNNGLSVIDITWRGIPGFDWTDCTITPEGETLLKWYCGNVSAQFAGNVTPWGVPLMNISVFFPRDEPGVDLYNGFINICRIIHEGADDIPILLTMNGDMDEYPATLLEQVDVYVPHVHRWAGQSLDNPWPVEIARNLTNDDFYLGPNRTAKKKLWIYHTGDRFPIPDFSMVYQPIALRLGPMIQQRMNVSGWLYWGINWQFDDKFGYGHAPGAGEGNLL
ncbi:MAG: hypothetical protein ACFFCS_16635, partial [Candidatus Hodarchaeota archaeon]